MALIKCDECGKDISDKSKKCVNCGNPISKLKKEKKKIIEIFNFKNIVITLILLFLMITFSIIDIPFVTNYKLTYSIISVLKLKLLNIHFFVVFIGIFIFISFFLKLFGNKLYKMAYFFNYVFFACIFVIVFINNYRVSYSFYVLFALNIVMFLLQDKLFFRIKKENQTFIPNKILKYGSLFAFIIILSLNFIKLPTQSNIIDLSLKQVEISTEYINIRKNPSASSKILGKVYYKEIYTILDEVFSNGITWYKIKTSNNINGYIANPTASNYIKLVNELFSVPNYMVAFEINPSFVLEINNVDIVIGFYSLNDDAKKINVSKIINIPIKDSLKYLLDLSNEEGWLNDREMTIYIYDTDYKDLKENKYNYISSVINEITNRIDTKYQNIINDESIKKIEEEMNSKNQTNNQSSETNNNAIPPSNNTIIKEEVKNGKKKVTETIVIEAAKTYYCLDNYVFSKEKNKCLKFMEAQVNYKCETPAEYSSERGCYYNKKIISIPTGSSTMTFEQKQSYCYQTIYQIEISSGRQIPSYAYKNGVCYYYETVESVIIEYSCQDDYGSYEADKKYCLYKQQPNPQIIYSCPNDYILQDDKCTFTTIKYIEVD